MDSYRASLASEYLVKQPHALLQVNFKKVQVLRGAPIVALF